MICGKGARIIFFVGDEEESNIMKLDVKRTKNACEFLSQRKSDDNPFFYMLGYIAPHFPLIAPQKYFDMYKDKIPMPELPEDWFEKQPTNYKQLIYNFGIDHDDVDTIKKGRELYWALISWMDNEIGKVLEALGDSEVADNTIVVYTSDHGENKGDHGTWWKNTMYESSVNVPLIVNFPAEIPGGERRSKACSLLDLVQTIADWADAETPDDWNGDSLVPYIKDSEMDWKDMAVSEYYAHYISSGYAMLRKGDYKNVYYSRMKENFGPERELYNLVDDPKEWTNLATDPEQQGLIEEMHDCLVEELGRDPELSEQMCREDLAKGYDRN